jgi:hypothetical protein
MYLSLSAKQLFGGSSTTDVMVGSMAPASVDPDAGDWERNGETVIGRVYHGEARERSLTVEGLV